jgi:helix-turn-helix protein
MAPRQHSAAQRAQLVSAKQSAQEYGFKYTSLRDIALRGAIPIVRVGRAWYFDRRDIEQWIETTKETAGVGGR